MLNLLSSGSFPPNPEFQPTSPQSTPITHDLGRDDALHLQLINPRGPVITLEADRWVSPTLQSATPYNMRYLITAALLLSSTVHGFLNATENNSSLTIANERLVASVSRSRGYINKLLLDGQNLLGTENGNTGGL